MIGSCSWQTDSSYSKVFASIIKIPLDSTRHVARPMLRNQNFAIQAPTARFVDLSLFYSTSWQAHFSNYLERDRRYIRNLFRAYTMANVSRSYDSAIRFPISFSKNKRSDKNVHQLSVGAVPKPRELASVKFRLIKSAQRLTCFSTIRMPPFVSGQMQTSFPS